MRITLARRARAGQRRPGRRRPGVPPSARTAAAMRPTIMSRVESCVGVSPHRRRCRARLEAPVAGQPTTPPDFTGAWVPFGARPRRRSAVAPPAAGPIVLKPAYAKPYEARAPGRRGGDQTRRTAGERRGAVLALRHAADDGGGLLSGGDSSRRRGRSRSSPRRSAKCAACSWTSRSCRSTRCRPATTGTRSAAGRRHAGHRHRRHQGIGAGLPEHAAQRPDAHHRAHPAGGARRPARPDHDRAIRSCSRSRSIYTLAYRRMPGYKMVEFVCENNREYVDEQGKVRMRLRRAVAERRATITSNA